MDETRRFLRYVVPALVFVTELALLLLVTQQGWLIDKVFTELRNSGAGFAALLLAVAGGWGTCCFHPCISLFSTRKYGIDYREFVRAALDHGWLRLVTYGQKKDVARERVTRIMAWDVVALLWYRPESWDATAPEMGALL